LAIDAGESDRPGNLRLRAFGDTTDEVSIKKMSNRKMMSVREDMLNSADTLERFFRAMVRFLDGFRPFRRYAFYEVIH
jgi:hypothetical protein